MGHRRTVRSVLRFSFACGLQPHAMLNPRTPLAGVFLSHALRGTASGGAQFNKIKHSTFPNNNTPTIQQIKDSTSQTIKQPNFQNLKTRWFHKFTNSIIEALSNIQRSNMDSQHVVLVSVDGTRTQSLMFECLTPVSLFGRVFHLLF